MQAFLFCFRNLFKKGAHLPRRLVSMLNQRLCGSDLVSMSASWLSELMACILIFPCHTLPKMMIAYIDVLSISSHHWLVNKFQCIWIVLKTLQNMWGDSWKESFFLLNTVMSSISNMAPQCREKTDILSLCRT